MSADKTITSMKAGIAAARLEHKAARQARLVALQVAMRHFAASFENDPAEFAARVLLEIDSALPRLGPDPGATGPTKDTSRLLQRALADLLLLVGD